MEVLYKRQRGKRGYRRNGVVGLSQVGLCRRFMTFGAPRPKRAAAAAAILPFAISNPPILDSNSCKLMLIRTMRSIPTLRSSLRVHCRRPTQPFPPVFLDFLAPTALRSQQRYNSTTGTDGTSKPRYILSKKQREFMDSALRVNQAGELAATLIYTTQTPQVVRSHPHLRPLMKHMYDQEAGHLKTFNHLVAKHEIRPTAMYPFWGAAATFLGWSTAALGREAAMACTEAVETEIGSHYNDQVREILSWEADAERRGEELDDELKEMLSTFRRIRDEELEHLDHAVANDSKEARPYDPLVDVIRLGCRTAIKISEKV